MANIKQACTHALFTIGAYCMNSARLNQTSHKKKKRKPKKDGRKRLAKGATVSKKQKEKYTMTLKKTEKKMEV